MIDSEELLDRYTICMQVFAASPFDSQEATYWRAKAQLAYSYWLRSARDKAPESAPAVAVEAGDDWL